MIARIWRTKATDYPEMWDIANPTSPISLKSCYFNQGSAHMVRDWGQPHNYRRHHAPLCSKDELHRPKLNSVKFHEIENESDNHILRPSSSISVFPCRRQENRDPVSHLRNSVESKRSNQPSQMLISLLSIITKPGEKLEKWVSATYAHLSKTCLKFPTFGDWTQNPFCHCDLSRTVSFIQA